MQLEEFDQIVRTLLLTGPENAAGAQSVRVDPALNGLQVGRLGAEVARIAFAVDACMETFRRAIAWQADLQGRLPAPQPLPHITEALFDGQRNCLAVLPFGPEQVERVALVSGGGTRDLAAAIAAGVDLFVTGDAAHENYHAALEAGINVVSGGHYLSEVYGVRAVAERVARDTGMATTLIDVATGL